MKRHVWFAFILGLLFLGLTAKVAAEGQVRGTIRDAVTGEPIAFAYIAVQGGETLSESDDNGNFVLEVPSPPFTIRVVFDAYQVLDLPLDQIPLAPLLIELKQHELTMDTIEVWAERNTIKTSQALDQAKVEATVSANDPFNLVDRAPDVVMSGTPALQDDFYMVQADLEAALNAPVLSLQNPFSWRGLPYYSNAYFLDGLLPLSFAYYRTLGTLKLSVYPQDAVANVEMFGGGRKPDLGPGAGLMTTTDIKTAENQLEQTLSVSLLSASYQILAPLPDQGLKLSLSLRKSLYEYTWAPLIIGLNHIYKFMPAFGIGDALELNLEANAGNYDGLITLDWQASAVDTVSVLGFVANNTIVFDWETYMGGGGYVSYINLRFDDRYLQAGAKLGWEHKLSPESAVTLSAYELFTNIENLYSDSYIGGETNGTLYRYPFNDAGLKLAADLALTPNLRIDTGISGRLLNGEYQKEVLVDDFRGRLASQTSSTTKGLGLQTHEGTAWAELVLSIGDFEIEPSIRIDYQPLATGETWQDDIFPSALLHAYWYPSETQAVHVGGGLRSDRFDYLTRHVFQANQTIKVSPNETIDETYLQKYPLRLYHGEADYVQNFNDLYGKVGVYGLYADRLSGFNYQTYFRDTQEWDETNQTWVTTNDGGLKDTSALWSAGASLELNLAPANSQYRIDLTYNWSKTRYLSDSDENGSYEWVIPKQDVEHQIKVFTSFTFWKALTLSSTVKVLIGIPQTPHKVTGVFYDLYFNKVIPLFEEIPGEEFKMRDYMPRFNLDLKASLKLGKKQNWDLFLDTVNLFSFPRYVSPKVAELGFVEESTADRLYDWTPFDFTNLLAAKVDFGLRVKF